MSGTHTLEVEQEVTLRSGRSLRSTVLVQEALPQLHEGLDRPCAIACASEPLERIDHEDDRTGRAAGDGHLEQELGRGGAGAVRAIDNDPRASERRRVEHRREDLLEFREDDVVDRRVPQLLVCLDLRELAANAPLLQRALEERLESDCRLAVEDGWR